jgi:hypothetical protein
MADLLNARWAQMMEKLQTESIQAKREKIYIKAGIKPEIF